MKLQSLNSNDLEPVCEARHGLRDSSPKRVGGDFDATATIGMDKDEPNPHKRRSRNSSRATTASAV